ALHEIAALPLPPEVRGDPEVQQARRTLFGRLVREARLKAGTSRTFAAQRRRHEHILGTGEIAANRGHDAGRGPKIRDELTLDSHLRYTQIEVARSKQEGKRKSGDGRR